MKYELVPSCRARSLAERLSFTEALDQVCCPYTNFSPERNYGGAHIPSGTREEVAERVRQVQTGAKIPAFCTADLECGAGGYAKGLTRFPDFMALGANDSEQLAYRVGKATALEGRSVGLNWTFSPCVDIVRNPDSPVVSTRSASPDRDRVIRTARGYLSGLQDHGMLATLKHFPGDGYTAFDQHLTTVINPLPMAAWWDGPGTVYRELIEAGARTVMAGHIALPAYEEKDPDLDGYPPATLSRRLLTGLLREELGFGGLLVSDAMGMGGVVGCMNPYAAYARFLEAGGDCVLFARVKDPAFYAEMERLVSHGRLDEATVYDRAARVIGAKEDLGLLDAASPSLHPFAFEPELHRELSQCVVDGAVTLIRDRTKLLPLELAASTRVLHLVVANNYADEKHVYGALTQALCRRCAVTESVDPGPHQVYEWLSGGRFDLVVCSIGAGHSWGTSVARLHGPVCRNLMEGWMRLSTPVVFISHFHPFVHLEFEAMMDCVVNTFRSLETTAERVLRGLTGAEPFTGRFCSSAGP